jgi:hypothetical protein
MGKHRFIVVIPVADRPRHIRACLDSLRELLRRFPYDGTIDVMFADDSADAANVAANRDIATQYSGSGFNVVHFGPDEQFELAEPLQAALPGVLGNAPRGKFGNFGHKGQGVMRNIAYLKVAQMLRNDSKVSHGDTLIWSIDSDQEFRVNVAEDNGYVVDYFNGLDAIFSRTNAQVLTGKVVGDPPVSPAVMTANFMADVLAFLHRMPGTTPQAPCSHHGRSHVAGDAAYHDMADMFGFKPAATYDYPCPLTGAHSESDCFAHFASRVNSFFYGEHPTRVSHYEPMELFASIQPARTVYAGNYVFRPEALGCFIPFAPLRLRMSGPTLGRMVRAELGPRFVSANLPMLHNRTIESGGQSEFRPGITTTDQAIDLTGEFERQFQGDVMLFTVERLAGAGFPTTEADDKTIAATLASVHDEMLAKYRARHDDILARLAELRGLLDDPSCWWNAGLESAPAVEALRAFADNVASNFGDDAPGWRRINDVAQWQRWQGELFAAIRGYRDDRRHWENMVWPV